MMIALVFASFVTWTVLFYRLIELAVARSRAKRSVKTIQAAETLEAASDQLAARRDPAAFMARAALVEYRRSDSAIAVELAARHFTHRIVRIDHAECVARIGQADRPGLLRP